MLAFNSDIVLNQVPSRIFNDTIDFPFINETVLAYGSIIESSVIIMIKESFGEGSDV